MRRSATIILILIFAGSVGAADRELVTHDFGHVAIDFLVHHTFPWANTTDHDLRVSDIDIQCDCTRVALFDSTAAPGDTLLLVTTFNTKDYFGPTARSLTISFENDVHPEVEFQHRAIVGQWYYGLKPDPVSLFFLPSHVSKAIRVPNDEHKRISVALVEQSDDSFSVEVVKDSAAKGEQVELKVSPSQGLDPGTYTASLTLAVSVEGGKVPALLTVPIKIVRY